MPLATIRTSGDTESKGGPIAYGTAVALILFGAVIACGTPAYNSVLDRWELVGADAGTGLQDMGTRRRVGAEMHIEQRFGVFTKK